MKRKLTHAELEMLARLKELPDDQIDTIDIPEAPAENWRLAWRGKTRLSRVLRTRGES